MSLQFSTTLRNARANQLDGTIGASAVVKIYTGSPPANCAAGATGTELASFGLSSTWMSTAASGVKSFANTPISASAEATGTAGYFRVYDSGITTCHMQGTVGLSSNSPDLVIDNTSLNIGQSVQITGWSITEANA